jgi:cbb3-type cytochrome oxidase subunit 3
MRNLTAILCLTLTVLLGSAGEGVGNLGRTLVMTKSLIIATILTVFSTPAFAQSGDSDVFVSLLPLILILGLYYLFWRRQRKKQTESAELLEQRFIEIENRLDVIERSKR